MQPPVRLVKAYSCHASGRVSSRIPFLALASKPLGDTSIMTCHAVQQVAQRYLHVVSSLDVSMCIQWSRKTSCQIEGIPTRDPLAPRFRLSRVSFVFPVDANMRLQLVTGQTCLTQNDGTACRPGVAVGTKPAVPQRASPVLLLPCDSCLERWSRCRSVHWHYARTVPPCSPPRLINTSVSLPTRGLFRRCPMAACRRPRMVFCDS